ncbi:hypothetical protein JXR93_01625 [bacterium]|nr:hypothetical protein [bacterium]
MGTNDIVLMIEEQDKKIETILTIIKKEIENIKNDSQKKDEIERDNFKDKLVIQDISRKMVKEIFNEDIQTLLKKQSDKIAQLEANIESLNSSKKDLKLEKDFEKPLKDFEKTLNRFDEKISNLELEFGKIEQKQIVTTIVSEQIDVVENLKPIENRLEHLEKLFSENSDSLKNITNTIKDLEIQLNQKIEKIEKDIDSVTSYVLKSWVTEEDFLKITVDLESKIEKVNSKILSKLVEFEGNLPKNRENMVTLSHFESELQHLKEGFQKDSKTQKDLEQSIAYLNNGVNEKISKIEKKIENFKQETPQKEESKNYVTIDFLESFKKQILSEIDSKIESKRELQNNSAIDGRNIVINIGKI